MSMEAMHAVARECLQRSYMGHYSDEEKVRRVYSPTMGLGWGGWASNKPKTDSKIAAITFYSEAGSVYIVTYARKYARQWESQPDDVEEVEMPVLRERSCHGKSGSGRAGETVKGIFGSFVILFHIAEATCSLG
jgi:hypothetical protein